MSMFVLDNSVVMRWALATPNKKDQNYSELVLVSLAHTPALVPNLWHLEVVNVLFMAEKRGEIDIDSTDTFIERIQQLPITVDDETCKQAFSKIIELSRSQSLSSYDAAYLELAIRHKLPIATLDKQLQKAAQRLGVAIYLNS